MLTLQPPLTLVAAALSLLACSHAALASQAQTDADARLERALAQHRAGDMLGAIDSYLAILETSPERADVRSNLGAAYARLGRNAEAIEQYRRALAGGEEDPAIRFNLGLALFKAARFPESAAELERVLARQPDNKGARLLLAECHLQQGESAKVVELLAPHEAAYGDDRAYAYLLGSALVREDDLKRGQVFLDRALAARDSAETRLLMGAAHLRAGDPQAARDELRRAVELNPGLPGVHSLLGQALQRMADAPAAEAAYRRALELDPNDFDANLQLGSMRRDEGRYEEALAYLTRASRLRGDDLGVLHALGSLHLARGDHQKACEALEPLVKRAPEFQQGHVLLAMAYARMGRSEDAERQRAIAQRLAAAQQQKRESSAPAPQREDR
jgi:tetratricopeptide (TPR) repeat protein